VTDKLGEMIKVEVDQRLGSDKDTKLLVQNLLKNVMNEVQSMRETQDDTVQKILKEVKDSA
jgi:ethanolamine utilization protein EutQ (cupin superfamily)